VPRQASWSALAIDRARWSLVVARRMTFVVLVDAHQAIERPLEVGPVACSELA